MTTVGDFYQILDQMRSEGRFAYELRFFEHFELSIISYKALIAVCKEEIGENAITFEGTTITDSKWIYHDEGLWTHNCGTFYFDREEDAVALRLTIS